MLRVKPTVGILHVDFHADNPVGIRPSSDLFLLCSRVRITNKAFVALRTSAVVKGMLVGRECRGSLQQLQELDGFADVAGWTVVCTPEEFRLPRRYLEALLFALCIATSKLTFWASQSVC